jgi:cell shape-determining protein MreC
MKKKWLKILISSLVIVIIFATFAMTTFAAGNVAGAIESTWNSAKSQVQTVVNNVVFPVVDMILAILFFVKVGTSYFDYRKHGQFEFAAPAILFACLIFTLTAPLYIWTIL